MRVSSFLPIVLMLATTGCGDDGDGAVAPPVSAPTPTPAPTAGPTPTPAPTPTPTAAVSQRTVANFYTPASGIVFLPDGRMLVTELSGNIRLVTQAGDNKIIGYITTDYSGFRGVGMQDIVLDPEFATNARIWFSYVRQTPGSRLMVARATLNLDAGRLDDISIVWRTDPAATGPYPGGRLAFAPDGRLFLSTGTRTAIYSAQDLSQTLGKIVRINTDGSAAAGNPFASTAGAKAEIWSYGHFNVSGGLAFATDGRLFQTDSDPNAGDEFNLITPGNNYGWPRVTAPNSVEAPPVLRFSYYGPSLEGLIQYRGSSFVGWTGDFLIAGYDSGGVLIRVRVTGNSATEVGRIKLGPQSIQDVEQGPDGSLWVLRGAELVELKPL